MLSPHSFLDNIQFEGQFLSHLQFEGLDSYNKKTSVMEVCPREFESIFYTFARNIGIPFWRIPDPIKPASKVMGYETCQNVPGYLI